MQEPVEVLRRAPYLLQAARPQTRTKENLLPLGLQVQIQVSVVCVRACVYAWRPLYVLQAARPQTCTKENLLPLGLQVQIQVSVVCVRACVYGRSTIRSSGCMPPNLHQRKPSSPGAPSSDTGQCSVCACVHACVYAWRPLYVL